MATAQVNTCNILIKKTYINQYAKQELHLLKTKLLNTSRVIQLNPSIGFQSIGHVCRLIGILMWNVHRNFVSLNDMICRISPTLSVAVDDALTKSLLQHLTGNKTLPFVIMSTYFKNVQSYSENTMQIKGVENFKKGIQCISYLQNNECYFMFLV